MMLGRWTSGKGATFSPESETLKPYNVKETKEKRNSQGECNLISYPLCQKPELPLPQGSPGSGITSCIKHWARF